MREPYMHQIATGSKTFEFRKYPFPRSVQRIWFYRTAPHSSIAHVCEISPARTRRPGDPPLRRPAAPRPRTGQSRVQRPPRGLGRVRLRVPDSIRVPAREPAHDGAVEEGAWHQGGPERPGLYAGFDYRGCGLAGGGEAVGCCGCWRWGLRIRAEDEKKIPIHVVM